MLNFVSLLSYFKWKHIKGTKFRTVYSLSAESKASQRFYKFPLNKYIANLLSSNRVNFQTKSVISLLIISI